ncbi:LAFE_0F15940g1_1 [Lachancea fermentati]|uniref:Mannosyltransferase n=1 Tax=Lachancea fermentati TaxID=4955 RepID=A0A1G4MGC9_LACFM|nr:LAFE_0F15940g1_1 [Lachancea fermentati]
MINLQIWHYLGYLIGLFVALEPSYIHPDEHFQSLGILWPRIMGKQRALPWEFSPSNSARSYVPLYLTYGPLLYLNKFVFHLESPTTIMYLMRLQNYIMFTLVTKLSLQFLLKSKIERSKADFFISTSYIIWCYQSHTFSNSIETLILLVVLSLFNVLIQDSRDIKCKHYKTSFILGSTIAIGVFNRITFPAFIILPSIPTFHTFFLHNIKAFIIFCGAFILTCGACIYFDTLAYESTEWCIAPLNNLLYNLDSSNLAEHGLHPRYTHILVNLPQMLGPSLIFFLSRKKHITLPFLSCISGIFILSLFKHQELRFLVPLMPLLAMSIELPNFDRYINSNHVMRLWLCFNIIMGMIMGCFHQRGVITALDHLNQEDAHMGVHIWWKTYSPPSWMYTAENLTSSTTNFVNDEERLDNVKFTALKNHEVDLKGCNDGLLKKAITTFFDSGAKNLTLIIPKSLHSRVIHVSEDINTELTEIWSTPFSLDFDHYDFEDLKTLTPGMTIFNIQKKDVDSQ